MARFGKLLGNTSASTINNWEKGNNLPKKGRLEQIALLGNTNVSWLLYGEFDQYVYDLLFSLKQKELLTPEQLVRLCDYLKKKEISYSQELAILTTANVLFPEAFQANYPETFTSNKNQAIVAESFTLYEIETQINYRTRLLPLLETALTKKTQATPSIDLIEQFLLFLNVFELDYSYLAELLSLLATACSAQKETSQLKDPLDSKNSSHSTSLKVKEQWDQLFTHLVNPPPS